MFFDLEARELRERIITICNESELPMEMKQYIIKDIYEQCKAGADKVILSQLNERKQNSEKPQE